MGEVYKRPRIDGGASDTDSQEYPMEANGEYSGTAQGFDGPEMHDVSGISIDQDPFDEPDNVILPGNLG